MATATATIAVAPAQTRSLAPYHLVTFQLVPDPEINALGALAIIEKEPPNAADTGG